MTPELAALAATAFVHLVAVMWSQRALEADVGREGNTGTRENLEQRISERTQRLRRALGNHVENTGLFVIAVVFAPLAYQAVPRAQSSDPNVSISFLPCVFSILQIP